MKTMQSRVGVALVVLLIFLAGCTYSLQMNAKKLAIMANDTYVAQYDDYMSFFVKDENGEWQLKPGVSDEKRDVLHKRYKLLIDLDKYTDTLNAFIVIGALPEGQTLPALEVKIIEIIRELE